MHGSSIGQDELSESEFATPGSRTTAASPWSAGCSTSMPPPFWRKNMRDKFPDFEGRVDRWQIIHYYAPSTICIDVGVAQGRHRRARGRPQPGRQRLRHEHDHPRDRPHLALLLGVHAQLPARQPADHHPAARGRAQRLRRGRGDARGPAGGDRRQPRPRVLQPQHRRRRHVGAPDPRPDARGRGRGPSPARLPNRRDDHPVAARLEHRPGGRQHARSPHDVRRITIARPAARPGRAGQPRRRARAARRRAPTCGPTPSSSPTTTAGCSRSACSGCRSRAAARRSCTPSRPATSSR